MSLPKLTPKIYEYVERIDLASKLRKILPKWRWSRPFSGKKSPHKFSDTDPSDLIISWFTHFKQPFSLENQKNNLFYNTKDLFHCILNFN